MIGRHKECQIRPKSRSVSRHHCLIYYDGKTIRIIDLESTSGTKVNEERIEPRTWLELHDGDLLRCGKIVFQLAILDAVAEPVRQTAAVGESAESSMIQGPSMLQGSAWQEVDIADYLGAADEAEREERYGKIREQHADDQGSSELSDEFDAFDDGDDLSSSESTIREPIDVPSGDRADHTDDRAETSPSSSESVSSKAKPVSSPRARSASARPNRSRPPRIPKKKRQKLNKGPGLLKGGGLFCDLDRLKMAGAVVLVALTLGLFGYSVYSYSSGPDVRVLEGID